MHLRSIKMQPNAYTEVDLPSWTILHSFCSLEACTPPSVFPEINATICLTDTSNSWKTKEVAVNLSPFRQNVTNRQMALLLFCFSLIWDWTEWYVFQSGLQINELNWTTSGSPVIQLPELVKDCPSELLPYTRTKSETWHTSGVYYICLFTFEK